jgi:tRNA (mo5U34)-methyltransferase
MQKRELTDDEIAEIDNIHWWHSIPVGLREGKEYFTPGIVSHCNEISATERYGLPEDLSGKTVLDVGAWDGGFSFEAERRKAKRIVASDIAISNPESMEFANWGENRGFRLAKRLLESRVEFIESSVNDLPERLNGERFDVVLFYGVLYHVIDPFAALLAVRKLTRGTALIETTIAEGEGKYMELRSGYDGDKSNRWYPTVPCVIEMLEEVGFGWAKMIYNYQGLRATFTASV